MMRRIILATFLLLSLTPSAWPKFKEDEQKYLDDQFKAVLDQMQALGNQVAAVNAQLAEVKQNQTQLQAAIVRHQHQLQDLDEMLSSLHIGSDENFSKVKAAIAEMRAQVDNVVARLGGQTVAGPSTPTSIPSPAPSTPTPVRHTSQNYITSVEGSTVMIDMGSAQGIQPGTRLAVYKAADPNTRVGVIEVTQVVDTGNSRARIVTMNAGVKPDFSDIVRVE